MSTLYAHLRDRHHEMLERCSGADPWLVLEGDWGGQIYLTVPLKLVAGDADIATLLEELDAFAWSCNEGEGADARLYDPRAHDARLRRICTDVTEDEIRSREVSVEDGVTGGMGGGELREGLWLHEEFTDDMHTRAKILLGLP